MTEQGCHGDDLFAAKDLDSFTWYSRSSVSVDTNSAPQQNTLMYRFVKLPIGNDKQTPIAITLVSSYIFN